MPKNTIPVHKGSDPLPLNYKLPGECPNCHVALEPTVLHQIITIDDNKKTAQLTMLLFCTKCYRTFLAIYSVIDDPIYYRDKRCYNTKLLATAPFIPKSISFSSEITKISPAFIKIYNQAFQAEQMDLIDICGMGYRKALEFLIKDFLIYKVPNNKDSIESQPLSQCIKTLANDYPKLGIVAERATWLGNDEAHYVRKHIDYDLETLKSLIAATIAYIDLELITDNALSIQRI